ncbi:MAG: DNA binding protein [Alteromonadaceae bacterium]|nr:DNA binding protein [Alteromonadaceae bacterium]
MAKSKLQEFVSLEQQIRALTEKLDTLKDDPKLQSEIDFKDNLENLMKQYDKSASDVIAILSPESVDKKAGESATGMRRKRKLKIYKNPNTGEVVETRGGNHKTLKAWKNEHGAETVESWLVRTED